MTYQIWDEVRMIGLGYEVWTERGPIKHEEAERIIVAYFGEHWKKQLDAEDASGLDGFITSFVHGLVEYQVYRVSPEIENNTSLNFSEQISM